MIPAIKNAFYLLGDDIVEMTTEYETLKKIGCYDGKWLEECKLRLLKQFADDKRANLFMPRMSKQMSKQQLSKWHI